MPSAPSARSPGGAAMSPSSSSAEISTIWMRRDGRHGRLDLAHDVVEHLLGQRHVGARDEHGHHQLVERGDEGEERGRIDAGRQDRQRDGADRRQPPGAEAARGQLEIGIEVAQARQQDDDDERQGQHGVGNRHAVPFADQPEPREQPVDGNREHDVGDDDRRRDAVLDQRAPAIAPSRQAESEGYADQQREHGGGCADLQAAIGRIDPGDITEVARVPFEREAGRGKAQIAARAERDRKQHEQRQHQEGKHEPARQAQKDPPDSGAALLSWSAHCRRPLRSQSPRRRATPWFSSQNATSVTASRITDSAPAKFQARNSRTCCSITMANINTLPPPSSAGVM